VSELKQEQIDVKQDQPQTAGRAALEFLEPQPAVPAQQALKAYSSCQKQSREDDLIVRYLPLVYRIVGKVVSYLRPPLSREDLISAGMVGLVKAARDYDASRDAEFKTYAYIRIRGAVIDEMRSWSFTPPNVRRQFEQAQDVSRRVLEKDGFLPSDEELAGKLGIGLDKMYRMFETARAKHFISLSGMDDDSLMLGQTLSGGDSHRPEQSMEREELIENLTAAIGKLSEKHRQVIVLYYNKELTMKQVAEVLEVTESRVSQLHAGALFRLSVLLKDWVRQ
jgi:RNA polymerase sigma factor for flagellar operon FliA